MPHNFTSFTCNYMNFTAEQFSFGALLFEGILFVLGFSAWTLHKLVNIFLKGILSTKLAEKIISRNFYTMKSFASCATGNKTKHKNQA